MKVEARSARGLVLLALLAVVWAAVAVFLWRATRVPTDLQLHRADLSRSLPPGALRAAERYSRLTRLNELATIVVLLGVLFLYARKGAGFARESAAGPIGTGMLLAMLGLAIVWLAQLPFQIVDLWWARRHGVVSEGYFEWIAGGWFGLAGEFSFICLAILIVMGFARWLGDRWWLAGAPVFVALGLLFTFVQPWLTPDLQPLERPALRAAAARLERIEHLPAIPVRVVKVSTTTTAPNAEAMGLGPSRRVVLWDTLLDGRFSDREVEVVLAHEFGHHARKHLWKGIVWYALFAFPGAYLIARLTRRRGGMAQAAAIPLSLFLLVALQTLALPIQTAITRHMEAEADWMALQATRDPTAARALFRHFVTTSYDDPSPPLWDWLLFENHPTDSERVGMVDAWEKRQAARSR